MTHNIKPPRGFLRAFLSFFKPTPAQTKPRQTGKKIMAAMARYEQQQAKENGVVAPPLVQQSDAPVLAQPHQEKTRKRDWLASLRPLLTGRARWAKPNRTGKKVLAALSRQNITQQTIAQPAQQREQPVSIKGMLSAFRAQAVTFAANGRKIIGGAVAATCLVAIFASTAFSPVNAVSSLGNDDSIALPQTISIAPLIVQDGGLNTPTPTTPDPTPKQPDVHADDAVIVQLSGTPKKVPAVTPTRAQNGKRVNVVFNAPAKATPQAVIAKHHKHYGQTKDSIAKHQATAIGLFAEAKGLAGKLDNAANNKAALFKYMKASGEAQRGGIMTSNPYVKNMHVEWAKLYMGVNGIPKNLKLAAQIALTAGKDNPATQKLLNEIFVTEPDVLIKMGGLTETHRSPLHPAGNWSSRAMSLHSTL